MFTTETNNSHTFLSTKDFLVFMLNSKLIQKNWREESSPSMQVKINQETVKYTKCQGYGKNKD